MITTALENLYWIGGSPCAGKSSVADGIVEAHGLSTYSCDDAFERHRTQITPDRFPVFHRLLCATVEEVWIQRSVEQQVDEELQLYREEFPLILDDFRAIPADRPVIAEGAALLPDLLEQLKIPRNRAIWIVPTEEFQREHYSRREWRHDVVRETSDPSKAWENWMARDARFAQAVCEEAQLLGYCVLTTDGSRSIKDTMCVVEEHFRLRATAVR
jgi:hypothetical protein